jgi:hypothetical protein
VLAPIELAQLRGNLELVGILMEKYGCTVDYTVLALQVLLHTYVQSLEVTVCIILSMKASQGFGSQSESTEAVEPGKQLQVILLLPIRC